ncbi:MAG: TIGR03086 family metal-binding protein [Phycicoccus sp.]
MTPDQPPAEEYRDVAGRFTALVEGVPDDETWRSPSPVEGWSARDVVRHLVDWFPGFLEAGTGIRLPTGPSVDDDPVVAWRTFSNAVQALLDDPVSAGVAFSHQHTGTLPFPVAVSRFFTADVFMHSWDLARATGQDENLDPARCAALLDGMAAVEELMRSSGQYGPRVEVPDDADPQTRLLAFIGRRA